MKHTAPLVALLLFAGGQTAAPRIPKASPPPFSVFEASISDMQAAMKAGRTTSHEIVQQYLTRIATYEDLLHAAITVNPTRARRRRRARSRARAGTRPRPAARHSDRAQGQHPHDDDADDGRRAGVRRDGAALRGDAHEEPARRRRGDHREDRNDGARQLRRRRHADQLQRGSGLRLQSVRSAPRSADDAPTGGR